MGLKYHIVAVDFDGTITMKDEYPKIGEMNMVAIQYLKQYKKLGGKLILFTCRSGLSLLHAITKCESYGLTFDAVNSDLDSSIEAWRQKHPNTPISNKPFYDMLIDDKNYPACVNGIDWVMVSRELLKQR